MPYKSIYTPPSIVHCNEKEKNSKIKKIKFILNNLFYLNNYIRFYYHI